MRPIEPLALHHSWPLLDAGGQRDLGSIGAADPFVTIVREIDWTQVGPAQGIGLWQCELAGQKLTWSSTVYDLFGVPRGAALNRDQVVTLYTEESRVAMERLRAHAIRHRRGFTIDVEINPIDAGRRWMRLIAAPVCDGDRVVRLHGLKWDVTPVYR